MPGLDSIRRRSFQPLSRRSLLGWLMLALGHPSAVLARDEDFPGIEKAVWVWKDRVLNPDELDVFTSLYGVGTILLYLTPSAAEAMLLRQEGVQERMQRLRSRGTRIYAMAGEPDWAYGPSDVPEHLDLLIRVQRLHPQIFAGIHLDVEPNALQEWNDPVDKQRVIEGTLKFYDLVRRRASDITIDAAVNPVFAQLADARGNNFLTQLTRRVNSIAIMAYRNRVPAAISWVTPAVGKISSIPWRMGVQVDENDPEPTTSWSRTPPMDFERSMVALDRELRKRFGRTGYAGLFSTATTVCGGYLGITDPRSAPCIRLGCSHVASQVTAPAITRHCTTLHCGSYANLRRSMLLVSVSARYDADRESHQFSTAAPDGVGRKTRRASPRPCMA